MQSYNKKVATPKSRDIFSQFLYGDLLHLRNDSLESLRVVHGKVGEHLTVDLDTSLGELTHQNRIAHTLLTSGSVDTLDPQGTEVALLSLTVAISVGKAFLPSVLGYCPNILAGTKVTASEFQNSFTFCS